MSTTTPPATTPKASKNPIPKIIGLIKKRPQIAYILGAILFYNLASWGYHAWQSYFWVTLYGNVDIRESNLGFRVSGKLSALYKDEGDPVKAGDLLAILDPIPSEQARDEAKADEEVQEATLENAQANFQRAQLLIGTKGISQEEYDAFKATLDQARANLDLMKARLASANTHLTDTKLVSPSDGVIITRAQEAGTILDTGSTVFTLSLENPVWVRAYIEESSLGRVHPGREVEITSDSFPGRVFHGQVGYISPRAEFTPKSVETPNLRTALVYRIRVVVKDPDVGLRQGMPVTVRIRLH